ncbi:hypothetical protein MHY1_00016 [Methylovirgula sp. HY1]|nr:hypothetical protein MHY1_00016 [Methylovirgula sp. HY1]
MSHFLELGYIRVLIDKTMLRLLDLERVPLDRVSPPDRKTRYPNFLSWCRLSAAPPFG